MLPVKGGSPSTGPSPVLGALRWGHHPGEGDGAARHSVPLQVATPPAWGALGSAGTGRHRTAPHWMRRALLPPMQQPGPLLPATGSQMTLMKLRTWLPKIVNSSKRLRGAENNESGTGQAAEFSDPYLAAAHTAGLSPRATCCRQQHAVSSSFFLWGGAPLLHTCCWCPAITTAC